MTLRARLTRWRVALGFLAAGLTLLLARPTWTSLAAGCVVMTAGELLRIWAAGHIEKSREITRSGPYRWTRHPLYLGSFIIGLGIAIVSARSVVAGLVLLYTGATLSAAMWAEEAHLRDKFGGAYDDYAAGRAAPITRRFSWSRARHNREHHTVLGIAAGVAVLAVKIVWTR